MDDKTLEKLVADIEDLKRSVRTNDPFLREIVSPPGWAGFSFVAGLMVSAFALPAHVLVARFGSFAAIPPAWKAALFAVLAMFAVGGGVLKMTLMARRAAALGGRGLLEAALSFFGGRSGHVAWPLTFLIGLGIALAFMAGHPWYAVASTGALFGVMANHIATRSGQGAYLVVGYWSIATSAASLPFIERYPYLCLFAVYGGMFFAFTAALLLSGKPRDSRAEPPA